MCGSMIWRTWHIANLSFTCGARIKEIHRENFYEISIVNFFCLSSADFVR